MIKTRTILRKNYLIYVFVFWKIFNILLQIFIVFNILVPNMPTKLYAAKATTFLKESLKTLLNQVNC